MKARLNYRELDANIRILVKAINEFPGLETLGSCGGHPEPERDQWPSGSFWVKFLVAQNDAGWRSLEFLAWLVNNDARRAGMKLSLYPYSPPPYMNVPGKSLTFLLEGYEQDPEELGKYIHKTREELYIAAGR